MINDIVGRYGMICAQCKRRTVVVVPTNGYQSCPECFTQEVGYVPEARQLKVANIGQPTYEQLMKFLNKLGFMVEADLSGDGSLDSPEIFLQPDTGLRLTLAWVENQGYRIARDRELHLVPITCGGTQQEVPSGG